MLEQISVLIPALVAGLLVLLTHVPLGRVVLRRGIIFIDLAIAQIAGLGVIATSAIGWEPQSMKTQVAAMIAALSGAYLLHKAETIFAKRQEAFIGISFVLAATAGLLLLAKNPHGGEQLQELLNGQILWVTWETLIPLTVLTCCFLVLWALKPDFVKTHWFYYVFAIVITQSVQVVGIYLVFASLVIPAFACFNLQRSALITAFIIGITGYAGGLLISLYFDLPTGASIVWTLAIAAAIFLFKNAISVKS